MSKDTASLDMKLMGPSGSTLSSLINNDFNPRVLRPYIGDDGETTYYDRRIGVNSEGVMEYEATPTANTTVPASLRFQDWRKIDEAVIKVAKPRLSAVADLREAGLEVGITDGMGVTVFSYENQSDVSQAQISMSGLRRGDNDRPVFEILNLPLPLIHKDFSLDARQIASSRRGNSPLDLTSAELSARRVAEAAENLLLGVLPSYTYGGGTVYGYTNHPNRLTKTITAPTAGGWTPATFVNEVLAMRLQSQLAYHYGPWMLYISPNLDQYIDEDYSSAKGDNTLRERVERVKGIIECKTIDYLQFLANTPYVAVLVQMQPETVREVIAMEITTVQWESSGGWEVNFKIVCSMTPQLRPDQNNNMGLVHGSAAYP